eukprot:TRINITY_DN6502_c0_g1_i1.p1 TRINITY_DN6502_c0_g1~~TRINITY_DN6502_c0_g1_i1.p1  ORF type:complete len:153 (+),score=33.37 TRINITY_DN6502_c0_g1_i1:49-507(+)
MKLTYSVALCLLALGLVHGAPQMFIWVCDGCTYGTKVSKAEAEFNGDVTGKLAVEHILGEDGSSSLEIKGPLEGLLAARVHFRIHEGPTCESGIFHKEKCDNCQSYISLKILKSRKLLTIGGENDVLNKALSVIDTRRGNMLGCAQIVLPEP